MAGRGALKSQPGSAACSYEGFDKLTSSTLKRHPKMELSKADLLKLLSVLEGELQAREIVIAVLKAEQVKQLLYPPRKLAVGSGSNGGASGGGSDPWASLQRDVLNAYDGRLDTAAVRALHGLQLQHLEHLIALHRRVQGRAREEYRALEQRCAKASRLVLSWLQLCRELEEERGRRAQDTAQGDDVTFLLEKEREHLRHEVDLERQQNRRLEKDLQQVTDSLEMERNRQKQMVLLLLAERKRLILRLIQERQRGGPDSSALCKSLKEEKARSAEMVEGLEEESKRVAPDGGGAGAAGSRLELERERFQTQNALQQGRTGAATTEAERLGLRHRPPRHPRPWRGGAQRHRGDARQRPRARVVPGSRAHSRPPRGVAVGPKVPPPAAKASPPTVPQVRGRTGDPGHGRGRVGVHDRGPSCARPPPPVPPNKPVLQRKDLGPKPPVPPRTVPDSAAQVGGGSCTTSTASSRYTHCTVTTTHQRRVAVGGTGGGTFRSGRPRPVWAELADFQSLLVSMAMDKPNSPLRGGS
ncbi:hypothetical protein HPB48_005911 [Haemaphysalis longicornis]|uniref:Cortactin-binding protein-2 N-terminal domain-containing protein n=1 Tax=Haemaphysalis longicornis TaxID=44386 RepID=A0A9J6FNH3_HAELO|nr:hypothetical protein HPB48_005911 [Haemaphysalis longicornis]